MALICLPKSVLLIASGLFLKNLFKDCLPLLIAFKSCLSASLANFRASFSLSLLTFAICFCLNFLSASLTFLSSGKDSSAAFALTFIVTLPPGLYLFNSKISSSVLPVILKISLNSGESTPASIALLNCLMY